MKAFLTEFFKICDYPDEAAASLLRDFDILWANDDCRAHFEEHIEDYEKNDTTDFYKARVNAGQLAEAVGVHKYVGELLIFCCLAKHLREMYKSRMIDDKIWLDSVTDLRTKLIECHKVHGIWGTFVASWFPQFFTLERFALGRLQYQKAPYYATKDPYTVGGTTVVYSDSRALEVHIPSTGSLDEESVIDSLLRAYDFFSGTEYIHDGVMICECSSWLLYAGLRDTLSPTSNVIKFSNCFDITLTKDDPEFSDCWRVFGKSWDGDAAGLCRNTDMQRRIAARLEDGKTMGAGVGVLAFDGKSILTKKRG